jgi:alpha-galactosidase
MFASTSGRGDRDGSFLEVLRTPDSVAAFLSVDDSFPLERDGRSFAARDVVVTLASSSTELRVGLSSPTSALTRLQLRWQQSIDPAIAVLVDSWERSYGELGWSGITPQRALPWYFATHDGLHLHAYGVKTGPAAMCFWQIDPAGVSLWLDVCNGGDGVMLGNRHLEVATVVTRRGMPDEAPVAALREFCKEMCPTPRLHQGPVFGMNDWYTAYGNNNEQMLLRMTDLLVNLAPSGKVRPYTVVDEGWKDGAPNWPSMASFAAKVKDKGVRPGIWVRALEADASSDAKMLMPAERFGALKERAKELAFDPTIPEALDLVLQKVGLLADWGFELVKHDYSTYDLLGRWGFEMGPQPTLPGWHFSDRSKTSAEIILAFYRALRTRLGEKITILGCTTVGHLTAGLFELQRTGDDTSGKIWERTRRMGINTLAFSLPQHGAFYGVDPDCVGITKAVPWSLNRQWLDLVAKSKTTLFISPEEGQVQAEQREVLRDAFTEFVSADAPAVPMDFFHETTPETWKTAAGTKHYHWYGTRGALPFTV